MKFYKIARDVVFSEFFNVKEGDVFCNSFYFGWVKCATNKNKTNYYISYQFRPIELIEMGVLIPLDKWDLVKLEPHLKKEMKMFDLPYSLKNDEFKTLEEFQKIKNRVRKYQNR